MEQKQEGLDRPVKAASESNDGLDPWRRWVFAPLAGMTVFFLGCIMADFVWQFETRAWTMLWGGIVFMASIETGLNVAG